MDVIKNKSTDTQQVPTRHVGTRNVPVENVQHEFKGKQDIAAQLVGFPLWITSAK